MSWLGKSRLGGRGHSRGAALVIALTIVAVAITIAVPFSAKERVAVARLGTLIDQEQARAAARGVEQWVSSILEEDAEAGEVDHLGERWAIPVPVIPAGRASLSGVVEDLRGRLNLNALVRKNGTVDETHAARMRRLFDGLSVNPDLVDAIIDWIDADDVERLPHGIESSFYVAQEPPYRAANKPLAHISELLRIKGISASDYDLLERHVSVLDHDSTVNVNTASSHVLMSLAKNGDAVAFAEFIRRRTLAPIESAAEVKSDRAFAELETEFAALGVGSSWFQLSATIVLPRAERYHHAIIQRVNGRSLTRVRWTEAFE